MFSVYRKGRKGRQEFSNKIKQNEENTEMHRKLYFIDFSLLLAGEGSGMRSLL